jgi:hypothetical protein
MLFWCGILANPLYALFFLPLHHEYAGWVAAKIVTVSGGKAFIFFSNSGMMLA